MNFIIINGPNLNLVGVREPSIYGDKSFEFFLDELKQKYSAHTIDYFQSNIEGELVSKLQEVGFTYDGIILNAGAYTHTSIALRDAIASIKTSVVEVHMSNTASRESFRHNSFITPVCKGLILGFGLNSYSLAIESFLVK
ncbi:MAG: 3-dehydroquinate dehydratase [Bacteroidetes bacterium]|nr:3-dehydroquinate dehydratase [Bacteroidota bacterium]